MTERFSPDAYLVCAYAGRGLFSKQSVLSFKDYCGRDVEGFFYEEHMKEGVSENTRLLGVSVASARGDLVSIVLPNDGTWGEGGRGQGGFIPVKRNQIKFPEKIKLFTWENQRVSP